MVSILIIIIFAHLDPKMFQNSLLSELKNNQNNIEQYAHDEEYGIPNETSGRIQSHEVIWPIVDNSRGYNNHCKHHIKTCPRKIDPNMFPTDWNGVQGHFSKERT
jgi:hypothetical protein